MWYQPKIDLKRKCLAGAEALARIRHPKYGVLLPSTFLPGIADGSIARLTEQALIATLTNWSMFEEAGFNLHLAINVPVGVLLAADPGTGGPSPAEVRALARHHPRSDRGPDRARHEARTGDRRQAARERDPDRDRRFRRRLLLVLSLRELPFVELKLDSSFVKNCATDATNAAICQTAVDLAHRFGSAAVAEGIENAADLQALLVMGCDFGQGVLIAPPMPQERFLDLLRQRASKPRPQASEPTAPVAASSIGQVA